MMAMQEETRIDWAVTYLDVMQAPEGEYRLAGTQMFHMRVGFIAHLNDVFSREVRAIHSTTK